MLKKLNGPLVAILKSLVPYPVRKSILRLGVSLARNDFHNYAYKLANAPNQELGLKALSRHFVIYDIVEFSPQTT